MCIAIVKTKEGKITDKALKNSFESNPHGAGVAWSENGTLWYIKGIFNEDEFIKSVRYAEDRADGAILIHCRISTSGVVDKNCCHPHIVSKDCIMIHNGVLDIDVPKDSVESDTMIFVRNFLQPLPNDFMFDVPTMNLIEYAIGAGNKFCFLHSSGQYAIVNEQAGEWKDGVWYSNDSYEDAYSRYCLNYCGYQDDDEYIRPVLTADDWMDLEERIKTMNPMDLIDLGYDPLYDYDTGALMSEYRCSELELQQNNIEYLMNVDEYLYELYEEQYLAAEDLIYKLAGGDEDESEEVEESEVANV